MIKKLFAVFFLSVCLLIGSYFYIEDMAHRPILSESPVTIEVPQGASLQQVIADMHTRKLLLAHPRIYAFYAKYHDMEHIKAGEYLIDPGLDFATFLHKITLGESILHEIRFIEGWNFQQIAKVIKSSDTFRHTISNWDSASLAKRLNADQGTLEGLLFPDTYHFPRTASDLDILKQCYTKMQEVLVDEWSNRVKGLPYESAYEALIMASIVEKETGVADERAKIAGVFVRRLQKNMRLQTDPTVIYGLGDSYQGNLTRKHLKFQTPYNTYLIKGLPPTPIAMPGREAIHAALHPEAGNALYFVAMGNGRHYFSATIEEHNRAVRQYQIKNRRSNYQSTVR